MEKERRFEDIAIALGWLSHERFSECLQIQRRMKEMGMETTLEDILVKKGYITAEQASVIHAAQGKITRGRIAGYELLSKLGEGGMGVVYKAKQPFLDRIVAIKVLLPKYAKDKEARERFLREIKVVSRLNHQNIVSCLDAGFTNNIYYYVMEYIQGRSLDKILRESGWLEPDRAVDITLQIASALSHIHRYNIVHRDVKPSNIIITDDGLSLIHI